MRFSGKTKKGAEEEKANLMNVKEISKAVIINLEISIKEYEDLRRTKM